MSQLSTNAAGRARTAAGRAGERIRSEVDRSSMEGGRRLGSVAGDVRSVGDEPDRFLNDVDTALERARGTADRVRPGER